MTYTYELDRTLHEPHANKMELRRLSPFRKRSLPLLTVDAIIGNQAFSRADVIMSSGLSYNKGICNFLSRLRKGDV